MQVLRKLSSRVAAAVGRVRVVMGAVSGVALTYGVYRTVLGGNPSYITARSEAAPSVSTHVQKPPFDTEMPQSSATPSPNAAVPPPAARAQPCVSSHDKAHALFLRIRVKDGANVQQVASSVARLQEYVEQVEAPAVSCCGNYHVLAGVGFGPEFYQRLTGGAAPPFSNTGLDLLSEEGAEGRVGAEGSVGGDVLIHAKSNTLWMLERLAEVVLKSVPQDSVLTHEVTYGRHTDAEIVAKRQSATEPLGVLNYQYSQGQVELVPPSGYTRTTPSLAFVQESGHGDTEPKRRHAAVDPLTGGSYVMTQRWVHDVTPGEQQGRVVMNEWVDKAWGECGGPPGGGESGFKPQEGAGADLAKRNTDRWMSEAYRDCLAIQRKHPKSQILCTPGTFSPQPLTRIVRQSVPYASQGGERGLFFISYCRSPRPHEALLDRLLSSRCSEDPLNAACARVLQQSHNAHGACFYFPGLDELNTLQ